MDAFGFTADDLSANRMGSVSERQQGQLKVTRGQWEKQVVGIVGLMILAAAVYILLFPQGAQIREAFSNNATIVVPVLGGVLLLWGAMLAYYWIKGRRMPSSKVSSVSGQVKLIGRPIQALGGKMYQRLKLGKREFMVTQPQAFALTTGATYTAYYVGSGRMVQIVSIEQSAAK